MSSGADAVTPARAEVTAVITRACAKCHSQRQAGTPCDNCGNQEPAEQVHLGVISATHKNLLRYALRSLIGEPLARYRTSRANKSVIVAQDDGSSG